MTTGAVSVDGRRIVKPKPADAEGDPPAYSIMPLSSADFGVSRYHSRAIWAFEAPTPPTSLLEQGMANVLRHFRVCAGRLLKDQCGRPAIHLNDQGVVFTEARSGGTLVDAMPFSPAPSLQQFLPPTEGVPELLLIQLTRFTCGGLAIGVAIHHRIVDGVAGVAFLNCWAKMVRGEPIHPLPVHDRSILMARNPPRPIFDHVEYGIPRPPGRLPTIEKDGKWNLVVKKFSFSGELVNRVKAVASCNAQRPQSRYVSVLAHAWRCISKARGLSGDVVTRARVAIDGRNRLRPPLPLEYAGNAVFRGCTAETTVGELTQQTLQFAATLIRDAIARVDDEYIRSAMDYLEIMNGAAGSEVSTNVEAWSPDIFATSLTGLPLYELDFGWGKPVYVGPARHPIEGYLIFVPPPPCVKDGDGGVDVVVGLFEPHMAMFEQICYSI